MEGIVIEPLKTVYWFIPKNACTTLKVHYAKLMGLDFDNPHSAGFVLTGKILPGYFNFCVVRHPLHRLYSCWANKVAPGHPVVDYFINDLDPNVFAGLDMVYSEMPFDDFVDIVLADNCKRDPHWAPQSDQVPNEIAYYKLEELPLWALFRKANKNHMDDNWRSKYTDRSFEKAVNYYKEDLKRYAYSI
jgi:hypothetical protein